MDELFQAQDNAAAHNVENSPVVEKRLAFLKDAVATATAILHTLPFSDEKQHAIRVLSVDAWSSLITSVRIGLWGNAPESLALLRASLETAAILMAVVSTGRYKTAVSEFGKRQRQLGFDAAMDLLGDTGKRVARLHGDLSNLGAHATRNRMRFAVYQFRGEQYDRLAFALDPESAEIALRYTLDVSISLLDSLEAAYAQDAQPLEQARKIDLLRSEIPKAQAW